jgi:hypothetical protein
MIAKMTLAAAVVAAAAFLTPAAAAPLAPQSTQVDATESGLVTQVHRRHHHHWRHCRRVCHGHLHYSYRHGHWHCHGHWHYRCHWH